MEINFNREGMLSGRAGFAQGYLSREGAFMAMGQKLKKIRQKPGAYLLRAIQQFVGESNPCFRRERAAS